MQRTSFSAMSCPIARGPEHVGEGRSILILRDAGTAQPVRLGGRHVPPEEPRVELIDSETGLKADPMLVNRISGVVITKPRFQVRRREARP